MKVGIEFIGRAGGRECGVAVVAVEVSRVLVVISSTTGARLSGRAVSKLARFLEAAVDDISKAEGWR